MEKRLKFVPAWVEYSQVKEEMARRKVEVSA